ncbi:MAG: DNA replication/repair protein RecF [Bdellovibrionales bacterium]
MLLYPCKNSLEENSGIDEHMMSSNKAERFEQIEHQPRALTITSISLTNFRNHQDLVIRANNQQAIVVTGANGSGKTSLLEAISLLVPGRGLRQSALADLKHRAPNIEHEAWAIAATLRGLWGTFSLGTGNDPRKDKADKRIVHIDGTQMRGQNQLAEHVAMAWMTPEMDRTLADGPSARRKLIDRLAYSFDPAHNSRVHRYEKALRERLRLLCEGNRDDAWLGALENDMAQTGVAIAAARLHLLADLQSHIDETQSAFPRALLALEGTVENGIATQPALLVEDRLRADLALSRQNDAQTGTCAVGPHRSDLLVTHAKHGCPAHLCSTGEQKALLIAIMLAYLRTLARHRGYTPIFLLDDIAAHLDESRRQALFEEIGAIGAQTWITGTDLNLFRPLLGNAAHIQMGEH